MRRFCLSPKSRNSLRKQNIKIITSKLSGSTLRISCESIKRMEIQISTPDNYPIFDVQERSRHHLVETEPSLIFWNGPHDARRDASGRRHAAPLGKLHRGGVRFFESMGWTAVTSATTALPIFACTSRAGGDFPADYSDAWPRIRQVLYWLPTQALRRNRSASQTLAHRGERALLFRWISDQASTAARSLQLPQAWSALLDDKREMYVTLAAAGYQGAHRHTTNLY